MEAPDPIPASIFLTAIDASLRVRKDYGDLSGLKYSIKTFGLIQPLVITWDENRWKLLAGGRRYQALCELGRTDLIHGKEVIVREELYNSEDLQIQLTRQSIELEENLKRKDMSWTEQVEGKKRLMEIMQQIYGIREAGPPTRAEASGSATVEQTGISVRKLAAMLGESPATVSQDIQLAGMIEIAPVLGKMETKTAALNRARDVIKAYQDRLAGVVTVAPVASYRVLVYVKDEGDQARLISILESMGYKCEPVIV